MVDLGSAIKKVEDGLFLKFLMDHNHYNELIGPELTGRFLENNKQLIYITSNKPSSILQEGLNKNKRDSTYFIDMVSGSGSVMSKIDGNTHFMPGPQSLTELGISIFTNEQFANKKKLIVLDSLPSLIEKNGEAEVVNFLKFLRQKVESSTDSGILLSITDENSKGEFSFAKKHVHEVIRIGR